MKILIAQQVREQIEQNPDTKLVMVLGTQAFKKAHIPNSLDISDIEKAKQILDKESKIIVYCSDEVCPASFQAYQQLELAGYKNIWRFAGGLLEWEKAGYPLISES